MKFDELKRQKVIEEYKVTREEIDAVIEAAKSDIKTAQGLLNSDVCWAFNIAYNAILQVGIALMYSRGFRPIGEAKHVSVILFLRKILGREYENDLNRFNQMRLKRHKAVYGALRNITEYEAKESVKFAVEFMDDIIKLVA